MSIESEVFRRHLPRAAELKKYGFTEAPEGWLYEEDLLAGAFRAHVTVHTEGDGAVSMADGSCVSGDVTDADTGESYIPLRIERQVGTFAAEVRKAYMDLLEDIAANCFYEQQFLSVQTERLAASIEDLYGDRPEHLFEKYPDIAVFRDQRAKKWYSAVMVVPAGQLQTKRSADKNKPDDVKTDDKKAVSEGGNSAPDPADLYDAKAGVEIMNLKLAPENVERLQKVPGCYPAYHMNKKHWITVLLDGTLPDDDVLALITESHTLACRGVAKSGAGLDDHTWVIPSAYDQFDVAAAFRESPDLEWQQAARMRKGDTVYIYVGVPVKAICYRCTVKETDIPNHSGYREDKYPFVVVLHLEETYPDDVMPLAKMRQLGLYGVRGARRVPEQLAAYMRRLKGSS